jgi:sodium-dependent dicarboxylate transporter 2/3/5
MLPVWALRLLAAVVAVAVYLALPGAAATDGALPPAARATAAVACFMAFLWITEAIPLAATALLPLVLFPVCGVMPLRDAARPYAHEFVFLFLGGFLLALAMERWNLHRRIALLCLRAFGARPDRLVAGFMFSTAMLSMWISNTACTMMMLPIALGVIDRLGRDQEGPGADHFGICMLLGIAYAASIGGVGTLIGTPPNVFLAGFLETTYGIELGFGRWMLIGLPLVVVFLPLTWLVLTRLLYPMPRLGPSEGEAFVESEYAELGPMSGAEKRVLVVFAATVLLWLTREPLQSWQALVQRLPGIGQLTDAGVALTAALVLFLLPADRRGEEAVLDWRTAEKLPWGVLLLFGGGLSLAAGFRESGLASWISQLAAHVHALPLAVIVLLIVSGIVFLTELTSNTATAATFLPVLAGVAEGLQRDPLLLVVPAALAASCAFMMPVATPPNAIVFGSGHLRMRHMVRAGLVLNGISIVLLMLLTFGLVVHILGT